VAACEFQVSYLYCWTSVNITSKTLLVFFFSRAKFLVYSAYYDHRGDRVIRIIGATRTRGFERVFCRYSWPPAAPSASSAPAAAPVAAPAVAGAPVGPSPGTTQPPPPPPAVPAVVKVPRIHFFVLQKLPTQFLNTGRDT